MGRPSVIHFNAGDEGIWVNGSAVIVMEGKIHVGYHNWRMQSIMAKKLSAKINLEIELNFSRSLSSEPGVF
jgi:hypothetical protein